MPGNSSNKFKEHFGLIPIDPTKNFYEHPCAGTLADMPKAVQTEEMVLLALETEKPYAFPVLSCAAAALKTAAAPRRIAQLPAYAASPIRKPRRSHIPSVFSVRFHRAKRIFAL